VPLKLVDGVGGERQAIAWLESERGVAKDLPVHDWKPKTGSGFQLWSALGLGADLVGFDRLAARLRQVGDETASLTQGGLLAVWRPGPADAAR
jgi:protease-4